MSDNDLLAAAALRLADGEAIDWAAHAAGLSEPERRWLDRLRQLEALAEVHASGDEGAAAVHDSIRLGNPSATPVPVRWGPLEILEKIGRGSYGDVYRARDTRLGRHVALKLLRHREHSTDEENTLVHEGHLLSRVRHPNVVTVYGAERIDGRTGLWMEFVEGETLEDELRRRGPLPATDVVDIGMTLCGALAAVHAAGLLHRDIKLQNVMRDADGRLVLMDFGAGDEATGREGRLAGTPLYLAPEVLGGAAPDVSTDLYALGVVLFRLATARFPVEGTTLSAIRAAHRDGTRQRVVSLRPDVPRQLAAVIDRAVAPNATARFATPAEMANALAAVRPAPDRASAIRRYASVIAAVLLVAAGWAVWKSGVSGNQPRTAPFEAPAGAAETSPSAREVWTGTHGAVGMPSPDGRWLPVADNGRLVLRNLTTGAEHPLNDNRGHASGIAVFSPDSRRILYRWREPGTDDWLLKIGDIDGRDERALHRTPADPAAPAPRLRLPLPTAFSPDGVTAAVVALTGDGPAIGLLDTQTGEMTAVQTFVRGAPTAGNFSPDGRYLTYSIAPEPDTPGREVRVLDLDSGESSVILSAADARSAGTPLFTPDGSQIAFVSNRTAGRWDLWTIGFAGGKPSGVPELLKASLGSASGRSLGFTRDGSYFYADIVVKNDGYIVDVDPATGIVTGKPTRVSERFVHSTMAPLWSPDGTHLAYAALGDGRPGGAGDVIIVVRNVATGAEREFTVPYAAKSAAGYYRWFPDGRSLLLPDLEAERRKFRRLDIATGDVKLLFETGPGTGSRFRTWIEPDGSAVCFNAGQPGRLQWVRRDLKTGVERTVITVNATSVNPSPDGRYLGAIEQKAGPAFLANLSTGAIRTYWAPKGVSFEGGGLGWVPDGRAVYQSLATMSASGRIVNPDRQFLELWYVPFDGQPRKSGLAMQAIFNLYLRPDGRQLGFSGRVTAGSVWRFSGLAKKSAGDIPPVKRSLAARGSSRSVAPPNAPTLAALHPNVRTGANIRSASADPSLVTCTPWGKMAVAVCNVETGEIRVVRPLGDPATERSSAAGLSPDGRRIAYVISTGPVSRPTTTSIRLIGADGIGDRELQRTSDQVPGLALMGWTRDGRTVLAAVRSGEKTRLVRLPVDGGAPRTIYEAQGGIPYWASLSPDGRFLLVAPRAGTSQALVERIETRVRDLRSGAEDTVLAPELAAYAPLWTPLGDILFMSNRLGAHAAYLQRMTGATPVGEPVLVREFNANPVIVNGLAGDGTLFVTLRVAQWDVFRAPVDAGSGTVGTAVRVGGRSLEESQSVEWSPDGSHLAYLAGSVGFSSSARIVVRRRNGQGFREFPFPGTYPNLAMVRWSPDGTKVATVATADNRRAVHVFDISNGAEQRLSNVPMFADFRWIDADHVLLASARGLERMDVRSAAVQLVTRPEPGSRVAKVAVSRDGSMLAALEVAGSDPKGCTLRVGPPDGPMTNRHVFADGWCDAMTWNHDGSQILVAIADRVPIPHPRPASLWIVPVAGGDPVRLPVRGEPIVGLSMSPDGRELLFTAGNPRPEPYKFSGFLEQIR